MSLVGPCRSLPRSIVAARDASHVNIALSRLRQPDHLWRGVLVGRQRRPDTFEAGDFLATRTILTGAHTGALMGMPATGETVRVKALDMARFEGGKGR
jgi:hypothetical protein